MVLLLRPYPITVCLFLLQFCPWRSGTLHPAHPWRRQLDQEVVRLLRGLVNCGSGVQAEVHGQEAPESVGDPQIGLLKAEDTEDNLRCAPTTNFRALNKETKFSNCTAFRCVYLFFVSKCGSRVKRLKQNKKSYSALLLTGFSCGSQ